MKSEEAIEIFENIMDTSFTMCEYQQKDMYRAVEHAISKLQAAERLAKACEMARDALENGGTFPIKGVLYEEAKQALKEWGEG